MVSIGENVAAISGPFFNTPLPPIPYNISPNSLYECYEDADNYDIIGSGDVHGYDNVYDNLYEPIRNNAAGNKSIYAGEFITRGWNSILKL